MLSKVRYATNPQPQSLFKQRVNLISHFNIAVVLLYYHITIHVYSYYLLFVFQFNWTCLSATFTITAALKVSFVFNTCKSKAVPLQA